MSPLMHLMSQWANHGTYTLRGQQIALHEAENSPEIRRLTHARLRRMDRAYGGVIVALFLREHPWVAKFTLYLSTGMGHVQVNVAHVEGVGGYDVPESCADADGDIHQRKSAQRLEEWWADHRGDMHSAVAEDELADASFAIDRTVVAHLLEQEDVDGLAVMEALEATTQRGRSQ